jgi:hypothetical protein
MNHIQDRSAHKGGGTRNFPRGDQNDRGKWVKPQRKGWMRGKIHDTWTHLPCILAASLAETVQLGWSQQFTACKIFISFSCGKAIVRVSGELPLTYLPLYSLLSLSPFLFLILLFLVHLLVALVVTVTIMVTVT